MSFGAPIAFFRIFRTRGVYANIDAFKRAIADTIDSEFGPLIIGALEETTADWKRAPSWDTQLSVTSEGISWGAYPYGDADWIWRGIDQGVRADRIIRPRRARSAVNPLKPAALELPPRAGKPIYQYRVHWRGIYPRFWSDRIVYDYTSEFQRICELGARRGVQAAQREGR